MIQLSKFQNKAQTGFEPVIFGLRDRRLTTWPLRQISDPSFGDHQFLLLLRFFPMAESLKKKKVWQRWDSNPRLRRDWCLKPAP